MRAASQPTLFLSMFCLLPSRPVLPALLPGEQLVPRDAGRLLPVSVPVCFAALLAVRVPRDTGPGKQTDYLLVRCWSSFRTSGVLRPSLACAAV